MICLTGRNGFIGGQLYKRLLSQNKPIETIPSIKSEIIYLFGSPSSVMLYNKNIDYCFRETINSFLEACSVIKQNNGYLVYPSSATVNNKNNSYSRCKAALEEIAAGYEIRSLGLRISACYGLEEHKGEYASIVYQWCKQMKNGERPVIWGDGTQTRDFIYIDDLIDKIIELSGKEEEGIVEIGTGINTSLNEVVATINKVLGTNIEPIYIEKPKSYIQDTPVKSINYKVSLEEGIKRIINKL